MTTNDSKPKAKRKPRAKKQTIADLLPASPGGLPGLPQPEVIEDASKIKLEPIDARQVSEHIVYSAKEVFRACARGIVDYNMRGVMKTLPGNGAAEMRKYRQAVRMAIQRGGELEVLWIVTGFVCDVWNNYAVAVELEDLLTDKRPKE